MKRVRWFLLMVMMLCLPEIGAHLALAEGPFPLTVQVRGTNVDLFWPPVAGANQYILYYAPMDLSSIGQIPLGNLNHIAGQLPEGLKIYVAIEALDAAGHLAYSTVETLEIGVITSPFYLPDGLSMEASGDFSPCLIGCIPDFSCMAGCGSDASCILACLGKSQCLGQGFPISLSLTNTTAVEISFTIEAGTQFIPEQSGAQTMMVLQEQHIQIPPGSLTVCISAYCMNPDLAGPDTEDTFHLGTPVTQESLLTIIQLTAGKTIDFATSLKIQEIIWNALDPEIGFLNTDRQFLENLP
jgi:hypothetical protein